jgi:hypothetical protein
MENDDIKEGTFLADIFILQDDIHTHIQICTPLVYEYFINQF